MNRVAFGFAAVLLMSGCSGAEQAEPAAETTGAETATVASESVAESPSGHCLEGTWTMEEGGFTKSFTFNADGTGEEVQSATDTRQFTWELRGDDSVHITYRAEGDSAGGEWDLPVDCESSKLMRLYTKQ